MPRELRVFSDLLPVRLQLHGRVLWDWSNRRFLHFCTNCGIRVRKCNGCRRNRKDKNDTDTASGQRSWRDRPECVWPGQIIQTRYRSSAKGYWNYKTDVLLIFCSHRYLRKTSRRYGSVHNSRVHNSSVHNSRVHNSRVHNSSAHNSSNAQTDDGAWMYGWFCMRGICQTDFCMDSE